MSRICPGRKDNGITGEEKNVTKVREIRKQHRRTVGEG